MNLRREGNEKQRLEGVLGVLDGPRGRRGLSQKRLGSVFGRLGPSWRCLEASGTSLRSVWGRLGSVLGCLGSVLGRLGSVLGRPGPVSDASWAPRVPLPGRLVDVPDLSWTVLAAKTAKGRKNRVFRKPLGPVLASILERLS